MSAKCQQFERFQTFLRSAARPLAASSDCGVAQVHRYVDGAARAATSIPPVSQFTRTSKPVPSRDSTTVPPHDMPVAKKLIVERAGRSLHVRGKTAWKETSPGICMIFPVDPERIARPGASIWALT